MSNFMLSSVFHVAKAVENVSVRLGLGKFEVEDNWRCRECIHSGGDLCEDCKTSWLYEIGHLGNSDPFERRLGITMGAAAICIGFTGFLGNASMGFWEPCALSAWAIEVFNARVPQVLLIAPSWKTYYDYLLILLFLLSLSTYCAGFLIAGFLLAMKPRSKRNWRRIKPTGYVTLLAEFLVYMYFLYLNRFSVPVPEGAFVLVPVHVGLTTLLATLFTRGSRDTGSKRLNKLDAGKQ